MKKRIIFLIILIVVLGLGFWQGVQRLDLNKTNEDIDFSKDLDQDKRIKEPEETEEINNISLLAVGDIMFHMPQIKSAQLTRDSYDFLPVFKYVKDYIEEADMALANFETVTAGRDRAYSGFPRFNSPEESILALKDAGFDILSTANNHSLDQGKTGIISTLNNIDKYGLKAIGTYKEPQIEPLIEELNGIKIGFLSYTYGLNGLDSLLSAEEATYMVNTIDEEKIEREIQDLKERDVDLVAIYIHWGNEYERAPSEYQISLGHKMIEWGGDIILGSHPHVIQKSEIINQDGKDKFIIYSMGNFISNQSETSMGDPFTEDGLMVEIDIEKNMKRGETIIKNVNYIPTWVYKSGQGNKVEYEILPIMDVVEGKIKLDLQPDIISRMKKSYKDTMETLKSR